mmetsp:Transcript_130394/g.194064  ORF Transcript_130394/g.194064 Transcript_130394/m.194064 type:complete len:447 (+) Transcript_130394:105-1445(+)|eukprot:CAMPEP_0117014606 /NCGR_PEP_ID=MMETSP0472-20121206/11817_1 /TAXON_ID=693140 ORGANISM="Tiarina fusus, Strain LIS" /NCGR_SAMPLE_ID=MMETSP0472 /ASSEMBLY_ACC=CAM_ASM_000603 /LENGTH=446 /DNA_ID=CAMNT_0004718205 /DNA_START=27 /DNA_END=1367 /DNA_ORIENTATION=-
MKLSYLLWGSLLASASAFQIQSGFRPVPRNTVAGPLAAAVDVGENTGRDIGGMDDWANQCGVQRAGGFQYTSEDGLDWSVVTTEDLPASNPVLYVPSQMILSSVQSRQEYPAVEPAVDMLNRLGAGDQIQQFCLFVKVLMEYQNGDQSPWYPWMNSLPRLYYNAVSMTDFCYECLPPLVFSLARKEKVRYDNYCDALKKVDCLSDQIKNDPRVTKWAFNVVQTRSVGPDGDKRIIPVADMFNHGTETEVDMNFDEEGNCNVYTTRDVPAGSPLRISYGDPTNPSHLFATYGFLDETSPATFCKIMTIKPNQELLDIGYDFSRMLFYKDTGDVSQEVWDVLLYQALASNRPVQEAFYQAHMNGDADTKAAIHQQYFFQTSSALKKHVDSFLKQLDELSAKGDGKDVNEHPRLPLILRHNEFVKQTFLRVKANIDPMVAQAAPEPAYA